MKILLIEDDAEAALYLKNGLEQTGHVIDHAADGEYGLHLAMHEHYDVLIVDRMLPERDGLSIIKVLRADENFTPVLILSALGEVDNRVEGLRAGGDDYLVKPFAFSELSARIDALVRRGQGKAQIDEYRVADLVLDLRKQSASRAGVLIPLQPRELRLLEFLMRHAGQVVTRTMLLEQVWDLHFDPKTNVIDVQISRLRSKIDKNSSVPLLHTIRGVGYKLSETP